MKVFAGQSISNGELIPESQPSKELGDDINDLASESYEIDHLYKDYCRSEELYQELHDLHRSLESAYLEDGVDRASYEMYKGSARSLYARMGEEISFISYEHFSSRIQMSLEESQSRISSLFSKIGDFISQIGDKILVYLGSTTKMAKVIEKEAIDLKAFAKGKTIDTSRFKGNNKDLPYMKAFSIDDKEETSVAMSMKIIASYTQFFNNPKAVDGSIAVMDMANKYMEMITSTKETYQKRDRSWFKELNSLGREISKKQKELSVPLREMFGLHSVSKAPRYYNFGQGDYFESMSLPGGWKVCMVDIKKKATVWVEDPNDEFELIPKEEIILDGYQANFVHTGDAIYNGLDRITISDVDSIADDIVKICKTIQEHRKQVEYIVSQFSKASKAYEKTALRIRGEKYAWDTDTGWVELVMRLNRTLLTSLMYLGKEISQYSLKQSQLALEYIRKVLK
nr:MAG TPA: hypothetical protein [Caudoviricetes sp.]